MIALGRHIIAELYNCDIDKINDVLFVEKSMLSAADKSGATVINSTFHHFSPFGISGVIVIQESHFSIHCWPEYGYASIDIYTCGDTVDPWIAYEHLKETLRATHGSTVELNRGQQNLIASSLSQAPQKSPIPHEGKPKIEHTRNIWFTQRNDQIALSLRHKGDRLFCKVSPFQKVEIYQTEALGKVLVLDGKIACAEEDEYVYHEMIAHVPVFSHPNPRKVLVVGGGDGGTVRELLRHEQIEQIDLVEIDECVIEASKSFLPELASSLHNPRVDVRIEDGVKFAKSSPSAHYDIVIIDSDDPAGPSKGLFSESFYNEIYRLLRDDGIMITQSESPRYNQHIFADIFNCYKKIYGKNNVYCYLMYLPSFPSGMWSFSFSSKGSTNPLKYLDMDKIDLFSEKNHLKYYDADIHKAAFQIPKFVLDILQ